MQLICEQCKVKVKEFNLKSDEDEYNKIGFEVCNIIDCMFSEHTYSMYNSVARAKLKLFLESGNTLKIKNNFPKNEIIKLEEGERIFLIGKISREYGPDALIIREGNKLIKNIIFLTYKDEVINKFNKRYYESYSVMDIDDIIKNIETGEITCKIEKS